MATPTPLSPPPDGIPASDSSPCPNCGSPLVRRYCPDCGQAAPDPTDYSLRAHFAEFADHVANLDGKIFRTAWALVARPGVLTADHLAGRRARYLRPLQLFLLVNILLFVAAPRVPLFSYQLELYLRHAPPSPALVATLVQRVTPHGHTHDVHRGGAAFEAYAKAFDARVEAQRKSLIILFAPALALVLLLLFAWRAKVPGTPRLYGAHLVFALHVLTFIWLVLVASYGIAVPLGPTLGGAAAIAAVLVLLATPGYLFLAVRRVYHLRWLPALGVTGVIGATFTALLLAYRGLLFFTTYYTL